MKETLNAEHIAAPESVRNIDDAILTRLRNSKAEAVKELEQSGAEAGLCYADKHAQYLELTRLDRWWAKARNDRDLNLEDFGPSGLADVLGGKDGPKDEILELIRELGGDDVESACWLDNFIVTALKRFNQIETKL